MINGPDNVSSILSKIYTNHSQTIADSLVRIASGKRISAPGDDFAGFVRASGLQSDVAGYRNIKQDLQDASALVTYGKGVGNAVAEDLTRMKELAELYGQTSDPDEKASYQAEYDTIVNRINDAKTNSFYDTTQVYQAGPLTSVSINTDGAQAVTVTTTAVGDESVVNNIASVAVGDIQNEINNANTYVAEMESFGKVIERNIKLTDTIISSKNATISAITEINEAEELSALTVELVRQDATIAMLAQAHFVNGLALYLYENEE